MNFTRILIFQRHNFARLSIYFLHENIENWWIHICSFPSIFHCGNIVHIMQIQDTRFFFNKTFWGKLHVSIQYFTKYYFFHSNFVTYETFLWNIEKIDNKQPIFQKVKFYNYIDLNGFLFNLLFTTKCITLT